MNALQLPELTPELGLLVGLGFALVIGVVTWFILRTKYRGQLAVLQERLQNSEADVKETDSRLQLLQEDQQHLQQELNTRTTQAAELRVQVEGLQRQDIQYKEWRDEAKQDLHRLSETNIQLKEQISRLDTQLKAEREQSSEKIALLENARESLTVEFKNLANEIFEDKNRKFGQQSRESIENVLKPLSGKLSEFQKRVEETYDKEAKERFSLVKEIRSLQELNSRISEDAVNLTNALKGDSKTQGSWGELTLERILEASGLVKGREYDVQVSLKDESGARLQPDVIVHLPDGKDVIIDSKVTLTAYHEFVSLEDDTAREAAAQRHLQSITSHIRDLSGKDYQKLEDLRTLDFVLMFLPVEDAFSLAVQRNPDLFRKAFDLNIVLVGPSTLLATLRTIQHIWRNEYQTKNAQEIARRAGDLYDKFVNFVADVEEVGQRLDKARDAYDSAHNKLSSGRGNLVSRAETLKKLGAKTSKQLPKSLVDRADQNAEIVGINEKK